MGSEFRVFLLTSALLASIAPAQNTTVPALLAGVEGGGGTNIPFGSNLACRYQVIYDVEELPWTGPRVMTGISIRPDFTPPGTAVPAKQYLDISVLMSTSPRRAADASATFADNYGTDAMWVLDHHIVQLPAQPAVTAGPRPANIDFVFTQPWIYGLTPAIGATPAPSSLLVEIWIHAQPSGSYRIDNLSSCVAPTGTFAPPGPACAVPGKPPLELTADSSMLAGSPYSWHLANTDPNTVFFLMVGATNTGGLFGVPTLPLPYPLFDPANPSLPSPGLPIFNHPAPDCFLSIDPMFWFAGVCDANGLGNVTLPLPSGRAEVGQTYFAQALVVAPSANPLRIITSVGRQTTICGPLGVARVYSFYDASTVPPQPLPLVGSVQQGVGPIIEVH